MKNKSYIFPRVWGIVGWVLLGLCVLFLIDILTFEYHRVWLMSFYASRAFMYTMLPLTLASLILIAFSREKVEDEYVEHLRAVCFKRSILVSYALFFIAYLLLALLNENGLLGFPSYFSLFTILEGNLYSFLIVYIIIFKVSLWCSRKSLKDEK